MDYGVHGIQRVNDLSKLTLIKKHLLAVFINDSTTDTPDWVRIENSADFSRSLNPVTEERDYIADEHPTTELTDYKPSEGITIKMYKGSKDFDLIYKMYKKLAIGGDAHRQILRISLFDGQTVTGTTRFYAEVNDATIVVDTANFSGSTLECTIYENGTTTTGWVEITNKTPIFHADDTDASALHDATDQQ